MSTEQDTIEQPKAVNASGWKKAAVHTIRCPSGVFVDIRIPDLAALIEAGQIPQHLLQAALGVAQTDPEKGDRELTIEEMTKSAAEEREFRDTLVSLSVVTPPLKVDEVGPLPTEDKEFLVAVATRNRDMDAEGEHIGGLMKSEKFRRFRELGEFKPTLEGA